MLRAFTDDLALILQELQNRTKHLIKKLKDLGALASFKNKQKTLKYVG